MAIYTGVADVNGDFTINFPTPYNGGEKITVTASKDGANKSIELFAPSELSSEPLQVGGSLNNFPNEITYLKTVIPGKIGDSAFSSNASNPVQIFNLAKSLIIGHGTTEIGAYSFENWASMLDIVMPLSLQIIGTGAFTNCTALKNFTISDSVSTISDYAFNGCSNVENVTIGSGCTSIGEYAFSPFSKAVSVTCKAIVPPTITSSSFYGIKSTVKYYVPAASLAAYKAANIWKTFASKIYAIP